MTEEIMCSDLIYNANAEWKVLPLVKFHQEGRFSLSLAFCRTAPLSGTRPLPVPSQHALHQYVQLLVSLMLMVDISSNLHRAERCHDGQPWVDEYR
jgi:hypothetical protein